MKPLIALIAMLVASSVPSCSSIASDDAAMLPDSMQSIPATFSLLTNEPSWRVVVKEHEVQLSGAAAERRLAVTVNEVLFDGRRVAAKDDVGTLEIRVTERLCVDSSSGKTFEYTGRLMLDEGDPVVGCGRPL